MSSSSVLYVCIFHITESVYVAVFTDDISYHILKHYRVPVRRMNMDVKLGQVWKTFHKGSDGF